MPTYNTLEGSVDVSATATATRTGATDAVAIVGGYDSVNADASVNAGEATLITDPANADSTFGTSEIARLAQSVAANGVGTIYGVPVAETSTTETLSSTSSGTLSNTPLFDPTVHPDHSIDIQDDSNNDITTNVVYDTSPSTPSDNDTANVNPINGKIEFDASDTYDVTYTYGDYSPAITAAADLDVRSLIVGTESSSVKSTLQTELADRANDFDFMRGYVGARPEIATASISSYTPDVNDWRVVEVAPARGTGADGAVRTIGAVGGFMSSQPIGPDGSGLFDQVNGLQSLNTEYRASNAKDFDNVTVLTRNAVVGQAVTTSTESQFKNIYATEIVDRLAVDLFGAVRTYAGGPQDIGDLETLLQTVCQRHSNGNPPDLGFAQQTTNRPYDVNVQLGSSNDVADASVTIVPFPIAETVNLSIAVSDGFVEFQGPN